MCVDTRPKTKTKSYPMKKTDKRTEKFEVSEVELRKAGGLQGAVGKIRRWAGHGARMRLGTVDRCGKENASIAKCSSRLSRACLGKRRVFHRTKKIGVFENEIVFRTRQDFPMRAHGDGGRVRCTRIVPAPANIVMACF
jgi:hypothetical protein